MIRVLCLAGGLASAAGLSQYPEFSQQYMQRLAGQVEALTVEVKAFDAAALAEGMGREEALQDLSASAFQERHQADLRAMFARHARLADNLTALRTASPLQRIAMPHRLADGPTLQAVWADFTPAVPVSAAGAASAGVGFLAGWAGLAAALSAIAAPLRRLMRRKPARPRREPGLRVNPPVARPTLVAEAPHPMPKLAGVRR